MRFVHAILAAAVLPAMLAAQNSPSQAALAGRVVDDAQKHPIADVHVSIHALGRGTYSDSTGAFRLTGITAGLHFVVARRIGYEAVTMSVVFDDAATVERDFVLKRVSVLDTISVREAPWLAEFDENRRLGLGKFLTPEDVEKLQGNAIANRLSEFPSVGLVRPHSNMAFLLTLRGRTASTSLWCATGQEDLPVKVPCGCYSQVYVDGMLMNPPVTRRDRGMITRVTPPFNVNSLLTMSIHAVEWYGGPAETPMRYNRPGSDCGVLVVHMKRGK
jgi:hypothetical protein